MSTLTTQEAVDAMLDVVMAVCVANNLPLVTEDQPVDGQPTALQPPYVRATIRHATGRQSSLANADGVRMFEPTGTLWVEVVSKPATGNVHGYSISDMVLTAYRQAKSGPVWFRNARLNEGPSDGATKRNFVLVDFTYSTLS